MRVRLETNYDPADISIFSEDGVAIEHNKLGLLFRIKVVESCDSSMVLVYRMEHGDPVLIFNQSFPKPRKA